jgi:hypothetical protein
MLIFVLLNFFSILSFDIFLTILCFFTIYFSIILSQSRNLEHDFGKLIRSDLPFNTKFICLSCYLILTSTVLFFLSFYLVHPSILID